MDTEVVVLGFLKTSEHGTKFTGTVKHILEALCERMVFEDIDGFHMIIKVAEVLNH